MTDPLSSSIIRSQHITKHAEDVYLKSGNKPRGRYSKWHDKDLNQRIHQLGTIKNQLTTDKNDLSKIISAKEWSPKEKQVGVLFKKASKNIDSHLKEVTHELRQLEKESHHRTAQFNKLNKTITGGALQIREHGHEQQALMRGVRAFAKEYPNFKIFPQPSETKTLEGLFITYSDKPNEMMAALRQTEIVTSEPETKTKPAALEKVPVHHFPKDLEQRRKMCALFQPGDVISTNVIGTKKVLKVDFVIIALQKMARAIGYAGESAKPSSVHIGVVVGVDQENGRVLISEAMPSKGGGLRTVDLLTHKSCVLTKGMGYEYQIYRPTTMYAQTAVKAADIALRLAPKASYLLTPEEQKTRGEKKYSKAFVSKFSFKLGLKSMFTKNITFHFQAQKRLFKGLVEEHLKHGYSIGGKKGARKFFCSAFGAQVFQKAQAEAWFSALVQKNPMIASSIEELRTGLTSQNPKEVKKAHKQLSVKAKQWAKEFGKELEKELKALNVDFKHMTPQDLLHLFEQNKVAEHTFNVTPPK